MLIFSAILMTGCNGGENSTTPPESGISSEAVTTEFKESATSSATISATTSALSQTETTSAQTASTTSASASESTTAVKRTTVKIGWQESASTDSFTTSAADMKGLPADVEIPAEETEPVPESNEIPSDEPTSESASISVNSDGTIELPMIPIG